MRKLDHKLLSIPRLGGFFKRALPTRDFAVGALGGLLGQGGVKYVLDKVGVLATLPPLVQRFMPLLSGVATGAVMYYADRTVFKKGRGMAYATGAITAGAVIQAWQELQAQYPDTFNDYVYLPNYNGMGLLVDKSYNGTLVDTSGPNMARLSAMHDEGDEEGI